MSAFTNFEIVAHGYFENGHIITNPEAFIRRQIKPSGFMEKSVHWLSDKNVPLYKKIALVFSVALASSGVGLLIGYPILFSAAVLIPLVVSGKLAMNELARKTIEEYRRIPLDAINEAFGGQQANFTILDSKFFENGRSIAQECAIRMEGRAGIQGKLPDGRPFFGFKVVPKDRELNEREEPTVLVIFQCYNAQSILAEGSGRLFSDWGLDFLSGFNHSDFSRLHVHVIDHKELEMIQQIFVYKNHPKWRLAE